MIRRDPHGILAAVLMLAFASALLVEAYVSADFAPDREREQGTSGGVPDSVLDGGPLVDTRQRPARSYHLPRRTIALTFDDGPHPQWTPQVMRVLDRYQVHATFFVIGAQVARHPGLVAELAARGHQLGVHTFTHPRLSALPTWRRQLEYSQTQLAIAHAAGVKSSLLRFPYSSEASALDNVNWRLTQEAGRWGYLTVLTDTDSRDWARPGVDAVVRNSTPDGDRGAVVLMHDSGGDRSQTVAALDRLIPALQANGYRFTTVSEGSGLATRAESALSGYDARRGDALVWAVRVADWLVRVLMLLFLVVGCLTVARVLLLFLLAGKHVRQRRSRQWSWGPPVTQPVSVVVPAFNEKEGIGPAVRSLAVGDYPQIEVVVVDDGSTDGTGDIADGLNLPNVRVIRVPNAGKAAALNLGLAATRHDLVVMVDGDTVFEPGTLSRLVQPFADPRVGAVAGNVKVGNRGSLVACWQHIEYVVGFNLDRRLYDVLGCIPTVPGAIGAFRRRTVREAGGVSADTLAEDTDLTMAVCRAGWKIVYEERARAWTEAPATLRQLWTQRYRWSYGTMQAMWKHRRAVLEPGPCGRIGLPFLALFGVVLPLLAPLVDILGLYGLFFMHRTETVIGWLAMLGLQLLTALVAFRLDRERLRPLWALPLQQFVYRQLMYLVVIHSVGTALTGARLGWQKLRRTGQAPAFTR